MTDYHIANDYYMESTTCRLGRTDIDYLQNCFENIARRTSCTARLLFHYNSALLTSGPPAGFRVGDRIYNFLLRSEVVLTE